MSGLPPESRVEVVTEPAVSKETPPSMPPPEPVSNDEHQSPSRFTAVGLASSSTKPSSALSESTAVGSELPSAEPSSSPSEEDNSDVEPVTVPWSKLVTSKAKKNQGTKGKAPTKEGKKRALETSSDAESTTQKRIKASDSPRLPTPGQAQYSTTHYKAYDHENPNPGTPVSGKFTKYRDYDDYVLYRNLNLTDVSKVPKEGVRLDDLTVSRVIGKFTKKELHRYWPVDFDRDGMIRVKRVPLGDAAKVWVNAGEEDIDGNIVGLHDQGFYYKWYAGIHQLCGKEGLDNGKFTFRLSSEAFKTQGFTFKMGHSAVHQVSEITPIGNEQVGMGAKLEPKRKAARKAVPKKTTGKAKVVKSKRGCKTW